MRRLVAAASFLLLTAQPAVPQSAASQAAVSQTAIPQLGASIDVSIVNVDVHVTDKQGNRVRGLTKNDFEIYEGGKLQPISNFAEYSSAVTRGVARVDGTFTEETAAPREKRTIAIFLERMKLPDFQAQPFVAAIKDALRKAVGPGDVVSLVLWDRYHPKHISFTDDLAPIEAALDSFAADAVKAQVDDVNLQRGEMLADAEFEQRVEEVRQLADGGRKAQLGGGRAAPAAPAPEKAHDEGVVADPTTGATLPMLRSFVEMKMRVAAINSLIDTMGTGADSKKILLLGTRRLGEVAGAEFAYIAGGSRLPADTRERWNTEAMTKSIVDTANASGVTLYPIYPPGLTSSMESAASHPQMPTGAETTNGMPPGADNLTLLNETVNLNRIAQRTGGLMASGVSDAIKLLPQIAGDLNDYYSLAYRVTASGQDRARDLTVRTKNRDYVVRARQQFVEKSDTSRMEDRLTAALFRQNSESPIALTAELGERTTVARRVTVPVTVKVPISALTALPQEGDKYAGAFSVYVGTAADLDELSDFTHKTQSFEFAAADLEKANAGWFTYELDVVVNKQAKYVAVGVLDEVSKTYGVTRLALQPAGEGR
jgi:VWFA-related protein